MTHPPIAQRTFWIFDLDGTLTEPVHDFAAIKRELDLDPDTDILTALEALPAPDRQSRERTLDRIEKDLARNAQGAPGSSRLLGALSERGHTMGVLTRNSV